MRHVHATRIISGAVLAATLIVIGARPSHALTVTFVGKFGTNGSGPGQLHLPEDLALDQSGNLYVADYGNNRVQLLTNTGGFIRSWGSAGDGDGQFGGLAGIAIGPDGSVYTAEATPNCRVQKFTANGTFITKWGHFGSCAGQFDGTIGIAVDNAGFVYVSDEANGRIQKFTSDGTFVKAWGDAYPDGCFTGDGPFTYPGRLQWTSDNRLLCGDSGTHKVEYFSSDGVLLSSFVCQLSPGPDGNFDDGHGHVIASFSQGYHDVIHVYAPDGSLLTQFGGTGTDDGQFSGPTNIVVDASGIVYICDLQNDRIQKFTLGSATPVRRASWGAVKSVYH